MLPGAEAFGTRTYLDVLSGATHPCQEVHKSFSYGPRPVDPSVLFNGVKETDSPAKLEAMLISGLYWPRHWPPVKIIIKFLIVVEF